MFLEHPTIRLEARMLLLSVRSWMMSARFSTGSTITRNSQHSEASLICGEGGGRGPWLIGSFEQHRSIHP